jgi:preprotein translocase subunit SecB
MADNGDSGKDRILTLTEQQIEVQAHVLGQYIKDLSFENPNMRKLIDGPGEKPNIQVDIGANVTRMSEKVFESAIQFKAHARNSAGVIYDLELTYAGLFQIENIPDQALELFLLVNCPALLFPYLRRLVADLSREGGFPSLNLDPVDFGALYVKRQRERAQQTAGNNPN